MSYKIAVSSQAEEDLKRLKKNEPGAYNKARRIILELVDHPETGTGKPERLSGYLSGKWSRRISKKHRLIYEIINETVTVYILSSYEHYGEK